MKKYKVIYYCKGIKKEKIILAIDWYNLLEELERQNNDFKIDNLLSIELLSFVKDEK